MIIEYFSSEYMLVLHTLSSVDTDIFTRVCIQIYRLDNPVDGATPMYRYVKYRRTMTDLLI